MRQIISHGTNRYITLLTYIVLLSESPSQRDIIPRNAGTMTSRLFSLIWIVANVLAQPQPDLGDEAQTQQVRLDLPGEPSPIGYLRRFNITESGVLEHVLELAEVH